MLTFDALNKDLFWWEVWERENYPGEACGISAFLDFRYMWG
jgi:hypothetical protein